MQKTSQYFLIILALTTIMATASTATYYLDAVNGNDSNPGTSSQPWKTIDKAKSTVIGGDTVKLRTGNYGAYYEPFGSAINRTDWVTYEADSGQTPVLEVIYLTSTPGAVNSYLRFRDITVDYNDFAYSASCAVYLRDVSYVQFYDVNIIGDGYVAAPVVNLSEGGISFIGVQHLTIDGCNIYGDGPGIGEGNSPSGISYEGMGKGFGSGIISDGPEQGRYNIDITITNNNIWSCGLGIGITGGSGWNVSNNHIHNMTWDGIYVNQVNTAASGLTDPILIANNHIHTGIEYGDAHFDGIQFSGYQINHVIVRGNHIHYIDGDALYLKGDTTGLLSTDWLIENNLVYDSSRVDTTGLPQDVRLHNCDSCVFRNNTICTSVLGEHEGTPKTPMTFTSFTNNVIRQLNFGTDLGSQGTIVKYENNNIIGWVIPYGTGQFVFGPNTVFFFYNNNPEKNYVQFNALFNNFDANDFSLAPGSIAINAADPQYAPATDILGNPRIGTPDIGAYEFQGSTPQECIDNNKLMDYIFQWKQGSITMPTLMQKIEAWKAGTGC